MLLVLIRKTSDGVLTEQKTDGCVMFRYYPTLDPNASRSVEQPR